MFITKEQLTERMKEENNLSERIGKMGPIQSLVPHDADRFRLNGQERKVPIIPEVLKPVIAATALMTSQENAAEVFDISKRSINRIISPDNAESEKKNEVLRDAIYDTLAEVRDVAKEKLMMTLGLIDEQSLDNIPANQKARVASEIAGKLSSVIDRTIQKDRKVAEGNSSHLHLYTPHQRPIETFQVIKVNENESTT